MLNFNPRAPRGARPVAVHNNIYADGFQPTRPARGATSVHSPISVQPSGFQPTRPARGATDRLEQTNTVKPISTHAPREGRDAKELRRKRGL